MVRCARACSESAAPETNGLSTCVKEIDSTRLGVGAFSVAQRENQCGSGGRLSGVRTFTTGVYRKALIH